MSKRKTSTQAVPQKHDKPTPKQLSISPTKSNAAKRAREARDARKFFMVLGIGSILLVIFLYFIFVGRK